MTTFSLNLSGQWEGVFDYGGGYGGGYGPVKFRMSLKDLGNGEFEGKFIELEGDSMNPGIATIKGYLEASFISFVKEYPLFYSEEPGQTANIIKAPRQLLTYTGNYDWMENTFRGQWVILADNEFDPGGEILPIATGNWKMTKL